MSYWFTDDLMDVYWHLRNRDLNVSRCEVLTCECGMKYIKTKENQFSCPFDYCNKKSPFTGTQHLLISANTSPEFPMATVPSLGTVPINGQSFLTSNFSARKPSEKGRNQTSSRFERVTTMHS